MKPKSTPFAPSTAVTFSKSRNPLLLAFTVTLCLAGAERAMAQRTWTGGGADANWSTVANWNTGPISGNLGVATFAGETQTTSTNDVSGLTIGGWNFTNDGTAGKTMGFVLSGSALTLGTNSLATTAVSGTPITDTINNDLVFNGNRTFNTSTNHSVTVTGNISETGGTRTLIKGGGATFTLSGNNTYTGTTFINNGTLSINSIADSVSGSNIGFGNLLRMGDTTTTGTLNYTGSGSSTARSVQIGNQGASIAAAGGGATISANGTNGGTGLKFTAAVFNTADVGTIALTTSRTLTLSGTNTDANTIGGEIANVNGATTLTNLSKTGAGRWILGGVNTYSGTTTVSGGVLQLGNASALGSGPLILSGGGVLGLNGAFTRSLSATPAAGQVQVGENGGFAAYGADHFVNLGGASATLKFTSTPGFPSNTLGLGSSTATHTLDFQNPLDLAGAVRTINVQDGPADIDAILSGAISSSGGANPNPFWRKNGRGTLMLSAQNTLGGTYQVVNGTLKLGGATGDVIPNTSTVTLGSNIALGTTSNCTFDINGRSETIGALTMGDTTPSTPELTHSVINTGAAAVLTMGGNVVYNIGDSAAPGVNGKATISANIDMGTATRSIVVGDVVANPVDLEISGVISGTGLGFTKTSAGTLLISGANTYDGPTTVSAGTLRLGITDTLPDASAVSIGAGTLDVSTFADDAGTLDVTDTGATLNIGSGGTMAFADSSAIDWTGGALNITGTVVLGSSVRFGTAASGLTATQLGQISINGNPGTYALNASGFLVAGAADPFLTWSSGAGFDVDTNNDGIDNGVAWLLGAANPNANANSLLPVVAQTSGNLTMTFDMLPASARAGAQLIVEHSSDLGISDSWTGVVVPDATGGTAPVTFVVSGTSPLDVEVTISSSQATGGKLFGRLRAVR